jgi:hypothetical protein
MVLGLMNYEGQYPFRKAAINCVSLPVKNPFCLYTTRFEAQGMDYVGFYPLGNLAAPEKQLLQIRTIRAKNG